MFPFSIEQANGLQQTGMSISLGHFKKLLDDVGPFIKVTEKLERVNDNFFPMVSF